MNQNKNNSFCFCFDWNSFSRQNHRYILLFILILFMTSGKMTVSIFAYLIWRFAREYWQQQQIYLFIASECCVCSCYLPSIHILFGFFTSDLQFASIRLHMGLRCIWKSIWLKFHHYFLLNRFCIEAVWSFSLSLSLMLALPNPMNMFRFFWLQCRIERYTSTLEFDI